MVQMNCSNLIKYLSEAQFKLFQLFLFYLLQTF